MKLLHLAASLLLAGACCAADLNGNWLVAIPNGDGTIRSTYLNLKHDGTKITGTIRATQFFYTITESTGGPDGFTVIATMQSGKNIRRVTYEGKLVGEELKVGTRRNQNAPLVEMTARRVAAGEGALPAYIAPPPLRPVRDNGLVRTPPMGWNSWNKFRTTIDDAAVRGIADVMVSSGMSKVGYVYINIDDTWEGGRDAQGNMLTNTKFPNMKALADYVHSKGLKLGIYSSPGPNTCEGYEGSYGHEEQDARTWAAWGIDYLKYDWCGAQTIYKDEEMQAVYQKMGEALQKTGRPIVYSLCQYGRAEVWKWGALVGGNLWRTTGDISDRWESMDRIGFGAPPPGSVRQIDIASFTTPGHFNDPDMLEIGNGGMTNDEYKLHMSLWSMLAAPLLAGNDLRAMTDETKAILMNTEVIAVDQDKGVKPVKKISEEGTSIVLARPLADGSMAVGLFNRGESSAEISVTWESIGLKVKKARDLWLHKDIAVSGDRYSATVPKHGVVLLKVSAR